MDDLRGKDLKIAYWLNTHRQELSKTKYLIILVIVGIIWLIGGIYFIIYLSNYKATQRAYSIGDTIVNYESIQPPRSIVIENSSVLESGEGKYDAYVQIQNPNERYYGIFSYSITVAGITHTVAAEVIMPGENKYLIDRGFILDRPTTDLNFSIESEEWKLAPARLPQVEFSAEPAKIYPISIVEAAAIEEEANDLTGEESLEDAEETDFAQPDEDVDKNTTNANAIYTGLESIITNNSPFGFNNSQVVILLRDHQDNIVGVHKRVINEWKSFDSLNLKYNWRRRFAIDTTAEVLVYTNFLDEENVIYPGE